jgi:hypothetical protein
VPPYCSIGVTDGARTRDIQYHKLALYQLNYGHHVGRQCATSRHNFHASISAGPGCAAVDVWALSTMDIVVR